MASITQIITQLPPPPVRGIDVESVFVSKANALFDALVDEVTELNTLAVQVNYLVAHLEVEMVTSTSTATTKATLATTEANRATTEANKASASAVSAQNSKTAIEGLITLLPADINLAYSKAIVDSKLEIRDIENFLDFKF